MTKIPCIHFSSWLYQAKQDHQSRGTVIFSIRPLMPPITFQNFFLMDSSFYMKKNQKAAFEKTEK